MKIIVTMVIVLMLSACASNPPARYMKSDAGREEFDEMVFQCKKRTVSSLSSETRDAYGNVTPALRAVNCERFNSCLASKGFVKSPKGDFVVRHDDEVKCTQ